MKRKVVESKARSLNKVLDELEANLLSEEEEVTLFQFLINSGRVKGLGAYIGNMAQTFITKGLCYERPRTNNGSNAASKIESGV